MFEKLLKRARTILQFAVGKRPSYFSVNMPRAGIYIDEDRALALSAVYACIRVISETVGYLAWHVYSLREDGGRTLQADSRIDELLDRQPNPEMSSAQWRETMLAHALGWGNGYAEIERDGTGRPLNIWPLPPDRTWADRDAQRNLVYVVQQEDGKQISLRPEDIFHLRGVSWDGIGGYSIIRLARESLGLTAAAERFGAAFFGNGARPGMALEHPGKLSDPARENLKKSVKEEHGGPDRALGLMVLEEGMKLNTFSIAPEDAQFLETRKFQIEDIARWFRVPPHMIGHLDRVTNASIEQQAIEFAMYTILPWVRRLEMEADKKLFGRDSRRRLFTRMNLDSLLRGDAKSRAEALQIGITYGWLNQNDCRAILEMDPYPDGNHYFVPANLIPIERALNPPEPKQIVSGGEPPTVPGMDEEEDMPGNNGRSRQHGNNRLVGLS